MQKLIQYKEISQVSELKIEINRLIIVIVNIKNFFKIFINN